MDEERNTDSRVCLLQNYRNPILCLQSWQEAMAAAGLPWEAASGPVCLYVNYERYVKF